MSERLDRFVSLMKGIFELDKSDLDFGIYRIMNIRKQEIEKFLSEGLPQKVQETLAPFACNTGDIEKRLAEIEQSLGADMSQLPDSIPMVKEYRELKSQLAAGVDLSALETDVYSALYSFFNRYYDEGDFISKRRYKEGVYAIPYEGEEVKLYWANQDQYYIKTAENFKDYSFVARNPYGDSCTVHFLLVDATTEQNNNKESKDSKRTFMLYQETEEQPEMKTFEYRADTNEFIVRFVFDVPEDKKAKYLELNGAAIRRKIAADYPQLVQILLADVSSDKKKPKTLIDKHLEAYVAKNTFDYFIHKDLKGFLYRELDFYIKSEIIHLDDLDTTNEQRVETYLAKVKAVKRVGHIIIDFLAQIEDFQKKLWLKKKFVVETNWCMTLDRIDESFWPEIIANPAQIQEWIDMYAIDEMEGDLTTLGWTNPPTMEFLRQNLNLLVDTKHFSTDFKDRLVASIEDLDEQTVGVLINSDNFHALNLLQEKYRNKIQSTYIDPPYNSPSSEVLYKNSFKHSAWLSLMENRLSIANPLRNEIGSIVIAIDKYEQNYLFDLCKGLFPENDIVTVAVEHNKKGTQGDHFSFSHEYAIFSIPMQLKKLNEVVKPENEWEYSNFRNWGSESERMDAANCFYPVYVQNGCVIGYGEVLADDIHPESSNEQIVGAVECWRPEVQQPQRIIGTEESPIIKIWPIDDSGVERKWRYAFQTIGQIYAFLRTDISRSGTVQIKMPKYSDQYKTFWYDSKYNAGDYGTKLLTSMGFTKEDFEYPKSVYNVKDCIYAISDKESIVLDYFAGSGTTAQAVMMLNKEGGNRKFILVEMGTYFHQTTKPRVKKSLYATGFKSWKDGKPTERHDYTSGIIKCFSLESYEDALSNVQLSDQHKSLYSLFGEDYLIHYMLDIESKGSLLDLEQFKVPFSYQMKITERNETKTRRVDLVETFNYLIGISVARQSTVSYFRSEPDTAGGYEGAVRLVKDNDGVYGFKQVEGTLPDGRRALVIWRTVTDDLLASNAALDAYFIKHRINSDDRDFGIIYVNGDNNLANLRTGGESWKVEMTETEFKNQMFEEV